jgi:hypothetical protein
MVKAAHRFYDTGSGRERHFCCRSFAHIAEIANYAEERKKVVNERQKRQDQHRSSYNQQLDSSDFNHPYQWGKSADYDYNPAQLSKKGHLTFMN